MSREEPLLLRFPPLAGGTLVRRRNRFVAEVRLDDDAVVDVHLPNTGRLPELMVPGRRVRLRPAAGGGARRTRWSLALVESPAAGRRWIGLETPLANRLFGEIASRGLVAPLAGERPLAAEHRVGRSRFDFLLADGQGRERLVEVKSVNLFVDGEARFPDAPTERGRRHVDELASHAAAGGRAAVVFVLMGGEARRVVPNVSTDPGFGRSLAAARAAGVVLAAVRLRFTTRGVAFDGEIPVVA